jgi:hypothetical protein
MINTIDCGCTDMYSPKRILLAAFIPGMIFCFYQRLWSAEKPTEMELLVKELRPVVEFTGVESKEPFKDVFYKSKETAVEVKPVEKETQPPLPELSIQGIILGSSIPCVIINNAVLKEGESLGEIKISKIEKQGVKVLYKGWNYTLPSPAASISLKDPEGGKNEK